jgi:uncharacterized pyridoxamine 5'-phosphate oxidase family protein
MISPKIIAFLEKNEFVMLASCCEDMQPNVSPKFLLKVEGNSIYLGDYNIDKTWANVASNAKVSLASIDHETFVSIKVNGIVEEVEKGDVYETLIDEFNDKKIRLSSKRVIDGIHQGKLFKQFEMIFPDRVLIYKIKAHEITVINPTGRISISNFAVDRVIKKEGQ